MCERDRHQTVSETDRTPQDSIGHACAGVAQQKVKERPYACLVQEAQLLLG